MKFKSHQLTALLLPAIMASLACAGTVVAAEGPKKLIDIDAGGIQIDRLDFSRLAPGDSATMYTDDGRVIDILRKERGIEIFVDGEPLFAPSLHSADHHSGGIHGAHRVMIRIECESRDDDECAEDRLTPVDHWAIDLDHEEHEVIVIQRAPEDGEDI
jgi:hypothetical protein